jgi:uncharacterized protein
MNQFRSQITKRRAMIAGGTLAVLAVLYVGLSWYVVAEALKAEVKEFEQLPGEVGLTFEDVEFHSRGDESVTLRGWWFVADDPVGSIIWVHGLDENRAEALPLLKDLVDEGFSILAFDQRGHGQSDKVPLGAGYKEPADVHGAIDFLLEDKGVASGEVLLMGYSFGAAVVLMAAEGEPAVAGVYADSPFASLVDMMIAEIEKRTPIPSWLASLLRPGIVQIAGLKGIQIDEVEPEASVGRYTDMVIGLAHCLDDERIPVEHSYRIREAAADTGVWFNRYPRCGHTEGYDNFRDQYVSIVTNYFLDQLGLLEIAP